MTNISYELTTDDVAKLLRYNVQYVRQLAANGDLPAVKRRRRWFFNRQEVLALYQSNTSNSKATDGN